MQVKHNLVCLSGNVGNSVNYLNSEQYLIKYYEIVLNYLRVQFPVCQRYIAIAGEIIWVLI